MEKWSQLRTPILPDTVRFSILFLRESSISVIHRSVVQRFIYCHVCQSLCDEARYFLTTYSLALLLISENNACGGVARPCGEDG